MSTTTLRRPEELRARLVNVAEKLGKSPHSLMVKAIAQKVEEEDQYTSLQRECAAFFEAAAGWRPQRLHRRCSRLK